METWYEVRKYGTKIIKNEFVRHTDSFLFREDGRREKIWSQYSHWFDSLEDAQYDVKSRLQNEITQLKSQLEDAESNLRNLGY